MARYQAVWISEGMKRDGVRATRDAYNVFDSIEQALRRVHEWIDNNTRQEDRLAAAVIKARIRADPTTPVRWKGSGNAWDFWIEEIP